MEQEYLTVQPKQKFKKWKVLFWIFLFFIAGFGIWYGLSVTSGPVKSEVKKTDMKYSLDTPDLPPSIKQFQGKYFSFYLPETYIEKRHGISEGEADSPFEQVFFTQMSDPGRKIAITIEQTDDGRVENLSSYAFRAMNPKLYQKDVYEWNENHITIFFKNDPVYEIVGYIEKNNRVASLAVSSAGELPEKLMSDFSDILKSFEWIDTRVK